MIKTLSKYGNSMALVIDKPILDLLKITPKTPIEITTDGKLLIINPIHDAKRQKQIKAAIKKGKSKYGRALANLAK